MASRRDLGPTDIARDNADVFVTAGLQLTRVLALVAVVATTAIALHAHVVVAPSDWVHRLETSGAVAALHAPILVLAVSFLAVTLESLMLCREVFARGVSPASAALLGLVRRVLVGARRVTIVVAGALAVGPRPAVDDEVDLGILDQLRRALSVAPTAPPRLCCPDTGPSGPVARSGHQAEVCGAV